MSARAWWSFFVPNISFSAVRKAVRLAIVGALIAGGFGILHDQVTYTISPEYFTRMKFYQFSHADFGFSERIFVAQIGFLATWWVGLIAAWFLARIAIPKFQEPERWVIRAILVIVCITVGCGVLGCFLGPVFCAGQAEWADALDSMGVRDRRAFYQVSGIHFGSYAGALLGWLVMLGWFLRSRCSLKER